MGNAISNAIYNIYKETNQNIHGSQQPTAPCPRCGANMTLIPIGHDGRIAQWRCPRCKYQQITRLQ